MGCDLSLYALGRLRSIISAACSGLLNSTVACELYHLQDQRHSLHPEPLSSNSVKAPTPGQRPAASQGALRRGPRLGSTGFKGCPKHQAEGALPTASKAVNVPARYQLLQHHVLNPSGQLGLLLARRTKPSNTRQTSGFVATPALQLAASFHGRGLFRLL